MAWPGKVFVGTVSGGVYYTANFGGPSDGQPTWVAVNDGLTNLNLRGLRLDPADPMGRQYCLDSDGTIWRREGGDWHTILTLAESRTLAGQAKGQVESFAVDPVTGYLYGWYLGPLGDSSGAQPRIMRSYDRGDTWAAIPAGSSTWTRGGVGNIEAYNGVVLVCRMNFLYNPWVFVSTDHGLTTAERRIAGLSSLWGPAVYLNPLQMDRAYVRYARTSSVWELCRIDLATGTQTNLREGQLIGPMEPSGMWFDPMDPGRQASLAGGRLWLTIDSWGTLVEASPTPMDVYCEIVCQQSAYQEWLVGRSNNGTGCVRITTDGVTTVGKAGANNATAPYTDSIPNTCGGICAHGIQAVGEMPGHWYLQGCTFRTLGGE